MGKFTYAQGSYLDSSKSRNMGRIKWLVSVERFDSGGTQWVPDHRSMNTRHDPWVEFCLFFRLPDWNHPLDRWDMLFASGLYKTKYAYWETHIGYPHGKNSWAVEGKGLCTILYRQMMQYALENGLKLASSEAYTYNKDVKKIYDRLFCDYNFNKRGKRLFLKNRKNAKSR